MTTITGHPAHVRDPLDRYFTPPELARACVAALPDCDPDVVVEPSVGGGAFARAARGRWPSVQQIGVDVDPGAEGLLHVETRFAGRCWLDVARASGPVRYAVSGCRRPLVLGNPPYRDAEAHVRAALEVAPREGVVGMLLRLGFLAGQKRRALWRERPPAWVYVLSRRPSFTGGGTDSSDYAWIVWDGLHQGPPSVGWLSW